MNSENFLIESIWILDKSSGLCIFEEIYEDFIKKGLDSDLIASFLSAILNFAGETFTEEIQFIKFTNRKILFEFSERTLFVIAIDDRDETPDYCIKEIIKEIVEKFNDKYESFLKDDWLGNTALFSSFTEDLRVIIKRKPILGKGTDCLRYQCIFGQRIKNLKRKTSIKKACGNFLANVKD